MVNISMLRQSVSAEGKEQWGNDIRSKPKLHTCPMRWYGELQYVVFSLSKK